MRKPFYRRGEIVIGKLDLFEVQDEVANYKKVQGLKCLSENYKDQAVISG